MLLLPATAAMGATLPAMARVAAGWRDRGGSVAALYAANTAGAVAGVLAAALWLVPALGQAATAAVCAALNLLCALLAWRLPPAAAAPALAAGAPARGLLPLLAFAGFLGIGYEVLVVRVASQVSENTVYTFAQLAEEAAVAGIGLGRVLGANTLGAALAPALVGVLALPAWGPKAALLALALAYALPGLRQGWRVAAAGAVAVAAFALLAPPLVFVDLPPGGRLLALHEGALGTVSVVEDAAGVRRLRIDNRQQEGSSATRLADERQALLPLLLHQAPRRVLFLGLGAGITAGAAARDPALQVEAVELLPEVVQAAALFADAAPARLQVHVADARRFVRAGGPAWDVVVADNVRPARRGAAWLTMVEHFEAVRARLAPGGLFCQWLPLHQLDRTTLRSIVAAFVAAFPQGHALLATLSLETPVLGLVATREGGPFDAARVRERLATAGALRPAGHGLADELAVLGSFVAGPAALQRWAAGAPPNTDDRPLVATLAPRITYAPDSLPRERLLALLAELSITPAELLAKGDPLAPRLATYWQARNRFLEVGRHVQPTADARRMLAQVPEPLLALLRTSPDFRPAREPLLRMAAALRGTDPALARDLEARLAVL